ncbi:cell wall metabolism sensor histidine kinase WalK [Legionella sp. km772]|uniref:sensor histidine kinase n=1 Tax=Legionella sp. km772 TaxID=2498111 RepID=UPI000F8D0D58|nr:HAMP domain-containing sensor histidine kinase [Legionella sp. km772]RUR08099.1 HAMP domain-containing histidine kinase [Legionella sp. km772]
MEKIDSGQMEFQFKPIVLNNLLSEAVVANQPYAEHFHVKIKLLPLPENSVINGDYDRLIQVLSNLISNAIKFSPHDGEIRLTSTLHHSHVEISVTDDGPGIPELFQPKIFQKFAQADSTLSRVHNGTGLGLNISKTIIERHGGTIYFKTNTKGTTFSFNLPIK